MVTVPVYIGLGNSNVDGIAPLSTVPNADFVRWTGSNAPSAISLPTAPYVATAPGVRIWTPKLPYTASVDRAIVAPTAAAQLTHGGAASGASVDSWLYIRESTLGQGQHRRITVVAVNTITVTPAWAPAIAADGIVEFLVGSRTIAAPLDTSVITITGTSPVFTAADVGRWVVFLSGTNLSQARRITAQTATTITLDIPLLIAPAAGDGIRVYTATDDTDGISPMQGSMRDLTFYYDEAASHSTGFQYPNIKANPFTGPRVYEAAKVTGFINFIPELSWQMRSQTEAKPHFLCFGISGSTLKPQNVGTTFASTTFSWARDITHLDWHPASPTGLYVAMTNAMLAMKASIELEGNEMDVRGFFSCLVENDVQDDASAAAVGANMTLLRDSLRTFCEANQMVKRNKLRIPWLTTNLRQTIFLRAPVANAALAQMALDDAYTGVIDSNLLTYNVDNVHFDGPGQITLGQLFAESWVSIISKENDALSLAAALPRLAAVRTMVLRRYERGISSNDSTDQQITTFINDSKREIVNTLGDMAWFMRRVEQATLDSSYPNTINLPRTMRRLLRIESAAMPGRPLVWKGLSYTDQGRVQVTLAVAVPGPYMAHFIQRNTELTNDDDIVILPEEHLELLVVLTCKRLAECAGNSGIASYWAAESDRLWKYIKRDAQRHDRMRQDDMMTSHAWDSWANGSGDSWMWGL